MDFKLDAFPVDDTVGGIRSTEKIKIIICYIIVHSQAELSRDNIQSALYDNSIANYFEISQAIDDLLRVGAITETNNILTVSEKGQQIAKDLKDELSVFIKNKAIRAVALTAVLEKRKRENDISITKIDTDRYQLDISMHSGLDNESDCMLNISLFVTDEMQAQAMKQTFLNNPVKLYEKVIEALTDDPLFKE